MNIHRYFYFINFDYNPFAFVHGYIVHHDFAYYPVVAYIPASYYAVDMTYYNVAYYYNTLPFCFLFDAY